ncbi:MAG: DNA internalization-related competence protein ComEC/Rec2 [Candidatus Thiodiazotropha sp. (ex Myrtea spinifera)]|nr:DNA internalization-related competence protein ComEC/Rec2 [Candidatus Thiodiazotropha sp. (ex Myrtea spinifera)]
MNKILIAFVAGAALFHFSPTLPAIEWLGLLLAVPLLWRYVRLRPALAMLVGGCWSLLFASLQMAQQLPIELEGRDLLAEGVVESLPQQRGRLVRFHLRISRLTDDEGQSVDLNLIRLNWYQAPQPIEPGQAWRIMVRLKRPRGMQNPAGFDYEKWLFSQRIQATGYVREWKGARLKPEHDEVAGLDGLRQSIATRLDTILQSSLSAALVKALTIGDRRGLEREDWRVFTQTGTNHLIAISGLHVGLVAGWMLFLGQWLWRRSERLTLRMPALRAGAFIGLLGALIYAALAGFALPTQRALLMLLVALGGLMLGRRVSHGRSLSLALFLVVLVDPFAPMAAGFWLSFGAVALILLAVDGRISPAKGWRPMLKIQASITLGLMPILFIFFGEASTLAPLINLLMVPWFAIVLVPASLMGLPLLVIPGLAGHWYAMVGFLMEYTFIFLQWLAESPLAMIQLAHLPQWIWLIALLGGLLLLMPVGIPGRSLGILMIFPVLLIEPERPAQGEIRFTLMDVGQGLACVIETTDHLLVYDTGPAYASGFNAAESAVLPYLASRNLNKIDRLIVSNNDQDHAGGLSAIVGAVEVGEILSGEPLDIETTRKCQAGETWSWNGVVFSLLHPTSEDQFTRANDRSCVLRISNGTWTLLLPGDIEAEAERRLVKRYGEGLKAQIVVAPHHGSKSSSGNAFVSAVDPEWVLFSTGYRNRYGFPKPEIVARWRTMGAEVLDSAEEGAMQLHLKKNRTSAEPLLYRRINAHYWSESAAAQTQKRSLIGIGRNRIESVTSR